MAPLQLSLGKASRAPSLGAGLEMEAEEFPICLAASWNLSQPHPLWERGSN